MPQRLYEASEVQALVAAGAQLVEVLPAEEYGEQHLPGAIHVPLGDITAETKQLMDPSRPVVVYCWDVACDLSPRAAAILEEIGFTDVADYVPGKLDWLARGLPVEGTKAGVPTLGSLVRTDVPTCTPHERMTTVAARVGDAPMCVVVGGGDVVFGVLSRSVLDAAGDEVVQDVMRRGPSTYRPHVTAAEMADHMREHDMHLALVSTLDGAFIGVTSRDDVDAAAHREK